MIELRKMRFEEYLGYRDYFIKDYGDEIESNYHQTKSIAYTFAEKDIDKSLLDNIDTKNNYLFCIELVQNGKKDVIGYLWYSINENELCAFVNDFYIFQDHRNKGYGKNTLEVLENNIKRDGLLQIKLRVAYTNIKALALYKEVGYIITGYNMSKNI